MVSDEVFIMKSKCCWFARVVGIYLAAEDEEEDGFHFGSIDLITYRTLQTATNTAFPSQGSPSAQVLVCKWLLFFFCVGIDYLILI
jgi:hypothetical protein